MASKSDDYKVSLQYKREKYSIIKGKDAIEVMKDVCKQILELVAENTDWDKEFDGEVFINKQSILNTIKQIE